MKICLFSDIHGNDESLEQMLESELHTTDLFIFSGDIFGYFYEQKKIIATLMSLKNLLAVKGNHEQIFLQSPASTEILDKYGSSYNTVLSGTQNKFIQQLPDYMDVSVEKKRFGIFHGGPCDYLMQRIYPDTKIKEQSVYNRYDFLILGHTHYRLKRKIGDTIIINPGSLGQPRDGKGFSYCILDTKNNKTLFKSVEVNTQKLLSQVKKMDSTKPVCLYLQRKYGGL